MKHVFLIKPRLGYYKEHPFVSVIEKVMKNYDYEIVFSDYANFVQDIIDNYPEKTRFYSVGGDGFLNQVIQKLVHTDHEVVDIPYGTGNDFSRLVNLSTDPKKVLIDSLNKEVTKIDTIRLNNDCYVNMACFGIDAVIANTVHDVDHWFVPRQFSYINSILRNVAGYPFYHVKVESEGEVLFDDKVTLCAFANGRYYGGGFEISPKSYINDGYIDMIILPEIQKVTAPKYVGEILAHTLDHDEMILIKRIKSCDISTAAAVNMDGEKREAKKYHLEIDEKSLNLVL